MKLFLSSMAISPFQAPIFNNLVGKDPEDIKLALIENATDPYDNDTTDWQLESREAIKACGYYVELVDLREFRGDTKSLHDKLVSKDALWLGGGNTFYLRWILRDTGADEVITQLIRSGLVYGGGSAGAIVAGPTLRYFEDADDPGDAPEVILEGLGLCETVVVPHIGNAHYGQVVQKANALLIADGYKTAPITDDGEFVVDD